MQENAKEYHKDKLMLCDNCNIEMELVDKNSYYKCQKCGSTRAKLMQCENNECQLKDTCQFFNNVSDYKIIVENPRCSFFKKIEL